jgi:hypothetical protein
VLGLLIKLLPAPSPLPLSLILLYTKLPMTWQPPEAVASARRDSQTA